MRGLQNPDKTETAKAAEGRPGSPDSRQARTGRGASGEMSHWILWIMLGNLSTIYGFGLETPSVPFPEASAHLPSLLPQLSVPCWNVKSAQCLLFHRGVVVITTTIKQIRIDFKNRNS